MYPYFLLYPIILKYVSHLFWGGGSWKGYFSISVVLNSYGYHLLKCSIFWRSKFILIPLQDFLYMTTAYYEVLRSFKGFFSYNFLGAYLFVLYPHVMRWFNIERLFCCSYLSHYIHYSFIILHITIIELIVFTCI